MLSCDCFRKCDAKDNDLSYDAFSIFLELLIHGTEGKFSEDHVSVSGKSQMENIFVITDQRH